MFGEKLILGEGTGKIDSKYRIFIPAFTKVEAKEELLLQYVNLDNEPAFKVMAIEKYFQIIERFQTLRDNATSVEEFEKYDKEIEIICQKLDYIVTIDKQKRLQMPHNLITKLNWKNTDEVEFKGLGETLLVRKKK